MSNKGLLEERDKEENGGCCNFLLQKQTAKPFVSCHVLAQSPPGRRPNDKCPLDGTWWKTLRCARHIL